MTRQSSRHWAEPAGETGKTHFDASFDIGSTSNSEQSGLHVGVSADDGQGGRMSYLRFDDQPDGIHVHFFDVTDPGPLNTVATFNDHDIATISRGTSHHVELSMDFVPGTGNDVVKVLIDGVLKATGGSWEDYYRYDPEQNGNGNVVPVTDTLMFPIRGSSNPGTAGGGYLFDNISDSTDDASAASLCTAVCYVDANSGSDLNGGTSTGDAFKSIQTAIDTVHSNGTIRVLPGHYREQATNRSPSVLGGTYNFGLFVPSSKPGIKIMGVDSSNNVITNPNSTLADITTLSDANFGPDGIFVEAANTTFQGLTIKGNLDPTSLTENDNKTFEVFADNFTLKNSTTAVPGGGSVYFNDPNGVIAQYHILGNQFTDGTSVDITGYTGTAGNVTNREIKNNTFDLHGGAVPCTSRPTPASASTAPARPCRGSSARSEAPRSVATRSPAAACTSARAAPWSTAEFAGKAGSTTTRSTAR